MASKIAATVPWKLKDAIRWLVQQDFYSSESEFVIIAVNDRLSMEHDQHKFVWAEVSKTMEDLLPETDIKNKKKE
jgi:Arc/MetJ-type ribon-helix-helix transcriptional regulator